MIYIKASGWKKSLGTYVLTVENLDIVPQDRGVTDSSDSGNDNLDSNSGDSTDVDIQGSIGGNTGSTGWLLSITISDYNGSANDLDGPIVDSRIIKNVFTDYYSVPQENVYQITSDEIVDYDAIDQGFNWIAENADSNDYVFGLLFWSWVCWQKYICKR